MTLGPGPYPASLDSHNHYTRNKPCCQLDKPKQTDHQPGTGEHTAKTDMLPQMDEGRKRTIGVIAAIFACRKLAALEGRPSPAREIAFRESIELAEELLRRIDARWPRDRIPGKT